MSTESEILDTSKIVAIVGLSPDPGRPSCHVADYLRHHGYKIIPVNPKEKQIIGETSYPNLTAIPGPVDVVDIFRRSEEVMPIVEEAIKIGAKAIWMQEGIINRAAADKASKAGLKVVMDRCMLKELKKLQSERNI